MKYTLALYSIILIMLCGCGSSTPENSGSSDNTFPEVNPPSESILHFIGRASVRIETKSGLIIYIDPYAGSASEYEKPADLVLVTHQHTDHNKVSLVTMKEDSLTIMCPYDIRSGDSIDFAGVKITAVDAYNDNHSRAQGCGFIIELNDLVVYHSGDTSLTEQMSKFHEYNIDYALLCIDGQFNMGPEEAMEVAELIVAENIIPIHSTASGSYSQLNLNKFISEKKIEMKPGDEIYIYD
jgi:L-ascorbate metabolism protein UlaG (beta-lactamase superfamily)